MATFLQRYLGRARYAVIELEPSVSDKAIAQVLPLKKKKPGSHLWMRFYSSGVFEVSELDRSAIMQLASIPARDLRILGPVFSQSSHILARERAMVVNLEFIKAIVTAEELFLLDATSPAVLPFVNQLKEQFPLQGKGQLLPDEEREDASDAVAIEVAGPDAVAEWSPRGIAKEEPPAELPFEFRVLEVALDVVCNYLEGKVSELESRAYPTLDELTQNVTSNNLELVRSIKSVLTRLTGRVQKVRDELEQLLNDDDDMSDLYLTRKLAQDTHFDSPSISFNATGKVVHNPFESQKASNHNAATSVAASATLGNEGVEELEMLLEAYFMQLNRTLNKLTLIREYIDDTEDYVNIQLDNKRNELFQFQISLTTWALAIAIGTAICSAGGMNIQIPLYHNPHLFGPFVGATVAIGISVFLIVMTYIYWKGLFEW